MYESTHAPRPRRPLREVVCDIDKDILKLVLRRHNLITRMHNDKGFLDPSEEKVLRTSWQAAVARISKDARLSNHFFSLLQDVEFLPRPAPAYTPPDDGAVDGDGDTAVEDQTAAEAAAREEARRTAFNLAPMPRPVRVSMRAPFACRSTRALLMLAAAAGKPTRLSPCLMNDPIVDFVKAINQAGASLTREDDGITAREAAPLGAPDKVLHVGDSAWNFFLLLAHYLGRVSRAKFTGETGLKLADFSATRRFLPTLGARLVHVVPKSDGLPVRIECSGVLPNTISLPADVPPELAEAILLAAPLYEKPLTLELAAHPQQQLILARTLPILHTAGAYVSVTETTVRVTPGPLQLPALPVLPVEPELANFLLALPLAIGGDVRIAGHWPQWPDADAGITLLHALGLDLRDADGELRATADRPLKQAQLAELPDDFPADWLPLPVALAACAALHNGEARLPEALYRNDEVNSFLHAAGLEMADNGCLSKTELHDLPPVWNAPTPAWGLALALAACARPHLKLGNPGCVTGLYPAFWALYNALPEPTAKKVVTREEKPAEPASRPRRIRAE